MNKFLRKFEQILKRICSEYDLRYRSDTARHGYKYFISRVGSPEYCVQIASTPRNKKMVGRHVKRDLLNALKQLGVEHPEVKDVKMSFYTLNYAKTVWEEIEDLALVPDLWD